MNRKITVIRTPKTHPLLTSTSSDENEDMALYPYRCDYSHTTSVSVPNELNPMIYFKEFIVPCMNQNNCGSCWAFASVASLTERFNYLYKKKILNRMLSPSVMIACDDAQFREKNVKFNYLQVIDILQHSITNYGCNGNFLSNALVYLHLYGTYDSNCAPYYSNQSLQKLAYDRTNYGYKTAFYQPRSLQFDDNSPKASCFDYTANVGYPLGSGTCNGRVVQRNDISYFEPPRLYRTLFSYLLSSYDEKSIMTDILKWGPLLTSFTVYNDFYSFDPLTEVYQHDPNSYIVGGHSVVISGWGIESDGTKYWWIKNSWGPDYGFQGYFKMIRGINECGVEENAVGIIPNIFPKNDHVLTAFLRHLEIQHGFYRNINTKFPIILQTFLKKYSTSLSNSDKNRLFPLSLCNKYLVIDYFFFHIHYPMLFHIDPHTGYNKTYLNTLKGLDFSWKHILSM